MTIYFIDEMYSHKIGSIFSVTFYCSTLKKIIQEGNLSTGTSVMNSVSSEDTLGELMCIAHLLIDNEWEFLCR